MRMTIISSREHVNTRELLRMLSKQNRRSNRLILVSGMQSDKDLIELPENYYFTDKDYSWVLTKGNTSGWEGQKKKTNKRYEHIISKKAS